MPENAKITWHLGDHVKVAEGAIQEGPVEPGEIPVTLGEGGPVVGWVTSIERIDDSQLSLGVDIPQLAWTGPISIAEEPTTDD